MLRAVLFSASFCKKSRVAWAFVRLARFLFFGFYFAMQRQIRNRLIYRKLSDLWNVLQVVVFQMFAKGKKRSDVV